MVKGESVEVREPSVIEGQDCPICKAKTLSLTEIEKDIPFFGPCFIFSMSCSSCKYHKADVEAAEQRDPCKITFEISSENDMNVRVVKSSEATIKIPHLMSIESGPSSNGYVTNIEGVLNRMKRTLESSYEAEEEQDNKKKLKNHIKKVTRIMWGRDKAKLIIEDPNGNSAIISDKAVITKLKK